MSSGDWQKTLEEALNQLSQAWLSEEEVQQADQYAARLAEAARERGAAGLVVAAVGSLQAGWEQALTANGMERILAWDPAADRVWAEIDAAEIVGAAQELQGLLEELSGLMKAQQFMRAADVTPRMKIAGDRLVALLFGNDEPSPDEPEAGHQDESEEDLPGGEDTGECDEAGEAAPLVTPCSDDGAPPVVETTPEASAEEPGEDTLPPDLEELILGSGRNEDKLIAPTSLEGELGRESGSSQEEAEEEAPITDVPAELPPAYEPPQDEGATCDELSTGQDDAVVFDPDRAFWHCLSDNRLAWAWWLSLALEVTETPEVLNTLPSWLTESLLLSTYCHPDSSWDVDRRYARERIEAQIWEHIDPADELVGYPPSPTAYALAAASLLPAFYEDPGHSAYNWLATSLQFTDAWKDLPQTAGLLRQTEELLRTPIPLHNWQTADRTARLNERLRDIQRKADDRALEAKSAQTQFVHAGRAQKRMLEDEGGLVRRLLDPVLSDDRTRRADVDAAVKELRDGDTVSGLVQHYYREILSRSSRRTAPALAGPAVRSVKKTVEDLRGLADEWLDIVAELDQEQTQVWQAEKVEELRARWAQEWPNVQSELCPSRDSGADASSELVTKSYLSRYIGTVGRSIMGHEVPEEHCIRVPQVSFEEARDRALWQVPCVWVALQARETDDVTLDTKQACELARGLVSRAFEPWSDERVVEESCGAEHFTLAAHVAGVSDCVSEGIRENYEDRVRDVRSELQRDCDQTLARLDDALAQGALSDDDHRRAVEDLDKQRSALKADSPEGGAFDGIAVRDSINRTLENVGTYTTQRRKETQEKLDALQQRLEEAPDLIGGPEDRLSLAKDWLGSAQSYLGADQFDLAEAACEQAEAALRGESTAVQRWSCDTLRNWRARQSSLERWLAADKPYALSSKAPNQCPLVFDNLPGSRRDECRRMGQAIRELHGLRPSPNNRKHMERLLTDVFGSYVGLEVKQIRYVSSPEAGQPHALFDLETAPNTDSSRIAVPRFGSEAGGRYRIVVVWDKPQVSSFRHYVGETVGQTPTFLLYPAPMSVEKWRQWAREVAGSKDSTPFIVLDECLLAHVADARGGDRLRSLFETALPYTNLNPYQHFGKVPPEMFVGRKKAVLDLGNRGGSYVIYGGRQLGKSAILEQLERLLHKPKEYSWVIRDDFKTIGAEGSIDPTREFWERVVARVNALDCPDLKIAVNCKPETVVDRLVEYFRAGSPRRLLLLVDEADNLLTHDAEKDFHSVGLLRRAIDQTNLNFKVVFAGLHNVQRFEKQSNHPLLQLGTPIPLGPLSPLDAGELIQRPMSALGYEIEDDAVLKIRVYSSDHPGLLQYFCRELLEQDRRRRAEGESPDKAKMPFGISVEDVEQVFSKEGTREELRKRFKATVDLDPQYQVLLYSQLQQQLENGGSMNRQFGAREALEFARDWWPAGFADLDVPRIALMLDEMVGLGVLQKQAGEDPMWYVRNRQVVRLLGGADAIESELMRFLEAPPSLKPDPARIHQRLRGQGKGISPLTQQQLALIAGRGQADASAPGKSTNGVVVLQSTQAAGQYRLQDAINELAWACGEDQRTLRIAEPCGSPADLEVQVARLQDQKKRELAVLWVPDEMTNVLGDDIGAYVEIVRRHLASARRPQVPVRVLFDMGFHATWRWTICCAQGPLITRHMVDMAVRPWPEETLRMWLNSHDVLEAGRTASRVYQVTGGWHFLVEEFWRRFSDGDATSMSHADPDGCLKVLAQELGTPGSPLARQIMSRLVPLEQWPAPLRSLWKWLAGGPLREIDLPHLAEPGGESETVLRSAFDFLCKLGYLQLGRVAGNVEEAHSAQWSRNPLASRLLAEE